MSEPTQRIEPPPGRQASADFNINEGMDVTTGIMLPSLDSLGSDAASQIKLLSTVDIATAATLFEQNFSFGNVDSGSIAATAKALGIDPPAYAKAANAPPSAFTFGRISYMPDSAVNGGVVQWPGLAPDALKKVVRENIAPQLIIGMRVDDVMRYSNLSTHLWKPGWRIEPRDPNKKLSSGERKALEKDIEEAQNFILFSKIDTGYSQVRKRDEKHLTGFQRFLSAGVRDALTYDTIGLWTDMQNDGKVKAYVQLPAGNLRLATRDGYQNDPSKFAVAVDDGGRVIQAFTRDELTFYTLNPRNDPDAYGYGLSLVEVAIRLVKGYQNAVDLNLSVFDRSAIANGILTISGGSVTQRQLDLLNRLLTNMKKGISKAWALPVIGLQGDSKIELIDLTNIKGNEGYYKEWINMLAGALCVLWRFPVKRLGYRIAGHGKDTEPSKDGTPEKQDQEDPGLAPLLMHFETLLNEYVIWTRWPHLQLHFCGKSPAEDSRSYEFRTLAMSYAERRAEAGLPPLEETVESDLKLIAKLMALSPSDPNLSSVFQTIASTFLKAELGEGDDSAGGNGGDEESPGHRMTSSKDPAKKESHGHLAGVRRDSAAEAK